MRKDVIVMTQAVNRAGTTGAPTVTLKINVWWVIAIIAIILISLASYGVYSLVISKTANTASEQSISLLEKKLTVQKNNPDYPNPGSDSPESAIETYLSVKNYNMKYEIAPTAKELIKNETHINTYTENMKPWATLADEALFVNVYYWNDDEGEHNIYGEEMKANIYGLLKKNGKWYVQGLGFLPK